MAVAGDGRRTRQVREAALRELKELKAQKQRSQQRQQKHQGQQAERTVTAVSPSVPAQPRVSAMPRRIMLAPVSILDDPKPSRDVKDAIPVPDSQDDDRRQRLLAFKEHVLATDDAENSPGLRINSEKRMNPSLSGFRNPRGLLGSQTGRSTMSICTVSLSIPHHNR